MSNSVGVERASCSSPLAPLGAAAPPSSEPDLCSLCRNRLLAPKNPILSRLGAKFPFEIAVGMNGRVWVKAAQQEGDEDKLVEMIRELKGDESEA